LYFQANNIDQQLAIEKSNSCEFLEEKVLHLNDYSQICDSHHGKANKEIQKYC